MAAVAAWSGRRVMGAIAWCKANLGWTCWLCGHEITDPRDYSVDHVIPRSIRPDLTWDRSNWRPAHLRSHRELDCPGNTGRGNGRRRGRRRVLVWTAPGW